MTQSSISNTLILAIAGTIAFNLSPIVLGYGWAMNICFMLYAAVMLVLSLKDRRVLGYATVLLACNPANAQANLSFSFLLAILTILREASAVGRVVQALTHRPWWCLFLAAFLLVGLSVPFWPPASREIVTEAKQVLSRLGYLVVFPLAVSLTIRSRVDGVRAVSLLCLMSAALLGGFYFWGQAGFNVSVAAEGFDAVGVEQSIRNISLNFNRTQVCIVLAALSVCALSLGVGLGFSSRALPYHLTSGLCVYLIMLLASTGSVFALLCGMVAVWLGYIGVRPSAPRIILGLILLSFVGSGLYWAVFHTENALLLRIGYKTTQIQTEGIDREAYWKEGIAEILKAPFGEGWTDRTGHSDWLLFLLSYGWAAGLAYIAAAGSVFVSLWRALRRQTHVADRDSVAIVTVGLAVLLVYVVNSVLDMLAANIGYFQTVWAMILVPAAVIANSKGAIQMVRVTVRPRQCVQRYRLSTITNAVCNRASEFIPSLRASD